MRERYFDIIDNGETSPAFSVCARVSEGVPEMAENLGWWSELAGCTESRW